VSNEFVIRIRADDAATATVNKIKAALSKVTDPVDKAQKRMGKLGDVGQIGLMKLQKGLTNVARAAGSVVDKIVEIIPGLTAIGGAASLAGLSALAVKFGNFGFGLSKSSKLLGMNARDLAAWHVAAKRAGVSPDAFDSSMNSSQMAIRAAAYGADPHAMMILQKMGVQIQRNNDGSIDYLTTQQRIMAALGKQKSVQGQREAAGALGMDGLLPMIQQGTWNEDKARAMRKGLVPSADEIERAKAFHQNINDLEDSVSGLGNSIGSRIIPILDPLVTGFAKWLDADRAQIAEKIGEAVQKFANWISSIDWEKVTSKADDLFNSIGGIKGVAIAVAAITFAGPISSVLGLISGLTSLATVAIPAAVAALGALGGAGSAALLALHSKDLNTGEADYLKQHGAQAGQTWTGDAAGDARRAANSGSLEQRQQYLFSRFKAAGYTDAQAAGQIGSLMQENGSLDPSVMNSSGHAGIAQWGSGRGKMFEKMFGHPVSKGTFGEQTDFYLWEMKNTEQLADKRIRMAQTPAQAAEIQAHEFERPGAAEANIPRRQANAESVYAAMTGSASSSDSGLPADLRGSQAAADKKAQQDYANGDAADRASIDQVTGRSGDGHDAQVRQLQQHTVTFDFKNVPQGARVDARSQDGGYMPTKVNYAMGSMP
jgi:hypothetical protein